ARAVSAIRRKAPCDIPATNGICRSCLIRKMAAARSCCGCHKVLQMSAKPLLLVQVSLVDVEVPVVIERLSSSLENLRRSEAFDVRFLVVFQTDHCANPPAFAVEAELLVTSITSVSLA